MQKEQSLQNAGAADGSIIMAQTGIELLFNTLIPEEQKKNKYNGNATNKLKTLLGILQVDSAIPLTFTHLRNFFPSEVDGPTALVKLRNGIVHSDKDIQDRLFESNDFVRAQALRLAIHYIEVSVLFFLKYKGEYMNGCAGSLWYDSKKQQLPWTVIS